MERFGKPGKTLLGSDSHTPAGGGLGMLAIGTGGLDVALAAAGEPYYFKMPKVMGIKLTGKLSDWVSAKDVILEMLRRYDVSGGKGYILEYYGSGVKNLSTWDRHVIANMGTELGATSTVFPSDEITKQFLKQQGRQEEWSEWKADEGAEYDAHEEIDLSKVEPLIALPSSPGNIKKVSEVAGKKISQVVVGSSANPGLRDYWMVSQIVKGKFAESGVSFDVNPSSRQTLTNLTNMNALGSLIAAGARTHQTGCMGCIGMGQAPSSDSISLRTMPRNFPGRSGTKDDKVYLCSPETAAASVLTGKITDPRDLKDLYDMDYPKWQEPKEIVVPNKMMAPPHELEEEVELIKGPNIESLDEFPELQDKIEAPIMLKMGEDVSTDEILKAGSVVLPLRSNIPKISKYAYYVIDESFYDRSMEHNGDFCVVAGENYAQGSSREHAAIAPRYLGQKFTIAKSYARIGWQNLINFGMIPFEFKNDADYLKLEQGDVIILDGVRDAVKNKRDITAKVKGKDLEIELTYEISDRQVDVLLYGGFINYKKAMEKEID
jgi:aconitate hydratase